MHLLDRLLVRMWIQAMSLLLTGIEPVIGSTPVTETPVPLCALEQWYHLGSPVSERDDRDRRRCRVCRFL